MSDTTKLIDVILNQITECLSHVTIPLWIATVYAFIQLLRLFFADADLSLLWAYKFGKGLGKNILHKI